MGRAAGPAGGCWRGLLSLDAAVIATSLSLAEATPAFRDRQVRRPLVAMGLLLAGLALLSLGWLQGARLAGLFALGCLLGLVLYHAAFGFASSWRAFVAEGQGAGIRVQMLMLAVASLLFFPILAQGSFFDRPVIGAVAPVGISVAAGAFLFGIGMQLGGGCASGTLYGLGGGSTRLIVTLIFFMAGSVLGSAHLPWWLDLPRWAGISLLDSFDVAPALALQLTLIAAIALLTLAIERWRRPGRPRPVPRPRDPYSRLLLGPWPLIAGGLALALLNVATLVLAGHPWTVSFGYTLWGAKLAQVAGADLSSWAFWSWPGPSKALAGSVFAQSTSVMNFGILLGAFLAAGLAGRFKPGWRVATGPLLAAVLGGTLMGYGARLAFGCNGGGLLQRHRVGQPAWLALARCRPCRDLLGVGVAPSIRPEVRLTGRRPIANVSIHSHCKEEFMAKGTKARLERKALELFVEKGIRETTVRDIAGAVGVAEGTLYRHYASKDALAEALFTAGYEAFSADLAAVEAGHRLLRDSLPLMIEHACRAFDEDWIRFSYLLLSQHVYLRQRSAAATSPANVLRDAIEAAMRRGEVPRANSELATAMVLGLVLQTAVAVVYGRLERPLADHAPSLAAAAWRVLAGPTAEVPLAVRIGEE